MGNGIYSLFLWRLGTSTESPEMATLDLFRLSGGSPWEGGVVLASQSTTPCQGLGWLSHALSSMPATGGHEANVVGDRMMFWAQKKPEELNVVAAFSSRIQVSLVALCSSELRVGKY